MKEQSPEIFERGTETALLLARLASRPVAAGKAGRRNLDMGARSVAGDRCRALGRDRDFPCKIHSNGEGI